MRYQKKAAILVLSIVCFLLTLASTVLGATTPQTAQVATETQSNQPSTTEQAASTVSKVEVPVMSTRRDEFGKIVQVEYKVTPNAFANRPAVQNIPVPQTGTPAMPAQPARTASAQPAVPAMPQTATALNSVSTQTPTSAGVSTIPTGIPAPRATTPAPAPKLTPTAPQKPAQVGIVTPAASAPKPMPNNRPKTKPATKPAPKPAKVAQSPVRSTGFIAKVLSTTKSLISRAVSWLGTRYVWGGLSARGVDCSGLTKLLYQKEGINLPHLAKDQFKRGAAVARAALLPGDLVFFNTARGPLTHVGIYIGNGQFLHAANPRRGVRIDKLSTGYYTKHYAGARRLLNLG